MGCATIRACQGCIQIDLPCGVALAALQLSLSSGLWPQDSPCPQAALGACAVVWQCWFSRIGFAGLALVVCNQLQSGKCDRLSYFVVSGLRGAVHGVASASPSCWVGPWPLNVRRARQ